MKLTKAHLEQRIEAARDEIQKRLDVLSNLKGPVAILLRDHLSAILAQLNGEHPYAKEE